MLALCVQRLLFFFTSFIALINHIKVVFKYYFKINKNLFNFKSITPSHVQNIVIMFKFNYMHVTILCFNLCLRSILELTKCQDHVAWINACQFIKILDWRINLKHQNHLRM